VRQFFGSSQRGDLAEAIRGLRTPQFIMLLSNNAQFESHVSALDGLFPGVPSIGCIGMSYDTRIVEKASASLRFVTVSARRQMYWNTCR